MSSVVVDAILRESVCATGTEVFRPQREVSSLGVQSLTSRPKGPMSRVFVRATLTALALLATTVSGPTALAESTPGFGFYETSSLGLSSGGLDLMSPHSFLRPRAKKKWLAKGTVRALVQSRIPQVSEDGRSLPPEAPGVIRPQPKDRWVAKATVVRASRGRVPRSTLE